MLNNNTKNMINASLILLYDDEGRLLLQHRTGDAERLPGYWAFFGGEIDPGETPAAAIRREALEELDYHLRDPQFVTEKDCVLPNAAGHLYVYVDHYAGDKSLLKLKEGQGWGWFKASEIAGLKMIEHDRETVKAAAVFIARQNRHLAEGKRP